MITRLIAASVIAGSALMAPVAVTAHPFLGALPYSKANTSAARSKEDCVRMERGRNHKRPPQLRGFAKHEHHYIASRTGDKCVTVFHNLRRGVSTFNTTNEKGEVVWQEVPTRQVQKRLYGN